jgi:hypothetical protein
MAATVSGPYTSRLIKASALQADAKALLAAWREGEPLDLLYRRSLAENILGKAARSRTEDVLEVMRRRYLADPEVAAALHILAQAPAVTSVLNAALYFHAAQDDFLLHDLVTEWLAYRPVGSTLTLTDVLTRIEDWMHQGRTTSCWGRATAVRVAQGAMATLRDFGVLSGPRRGPTKRLTGLALVPGAAAYIAFALHRSGAAGLALVDHPDWRLFLLTSRDAVERLLIEAQGERLLTYDAAGSIVRVEFPTPSLAEYARGLAARSA